VAVILFAGGPQVLIPNEPIFLSQLDDAIEAGRVPGQPVVVFRRHPGDDQTRWESTLARARHVVVDEPWRLTTGDTATSSAGVDDIERLVSTLAHSDVHISTSSTMTVDGAWFDKPQVGPAYDDAPVGARDRQVRDLYLREHWLPIARSGGMVIAPDQAHYIGAVGDGLTRPEEQSAGRRRLVDEIITYTDGRATERVAAEVARTFGLSLPTPGAPGAPHPTGSDDA
jgi:CDP-glycerol glycerophosphotransferase (TagB/SpsB family)